MEANNTQFRPGVLAPSSNFVPFLAEDLLSAFNLGSEEAGLNIEPIVEFAGYNADMKMLMPSIQRLIVEKKINCVIAPLNVSIIEKASRFFEKQKIPLIVLNMTEDPLFETSLNPFVFVNSFHLWHSAWMSGYLAGQHFGPKGATMVALHEGGYSLMSAFLFGLEATNGGLVRSVITPQKSSAKDLIKTIEETALREPDFIWVAYSGDEATSFLKAFQNSGVKDKIPLITIPPMVASDIRESADDSLRGIWYVTSNNYSSGAENPLGMLKNAIGREPNPYALMAYETAHLIAEAVESAEKKKDNFAGNFLEALGQVDFQGPRGKVSFNETFEGDTFYLRQIVEDDNIIEEITTPPLLFEHYGLACKNLEKTGWVNPYLCG